MTEATRPSTIDSRRRDASMQIYLKTQSLCKTGAIFMMSLVDQILTVVPLGCNRWDCERCGHRRARRWAARIAAAEPERFLTLTGNPHTHLLPAQVFHAMRKGWNKLVQMIRRKAGTFEYVGIWEVTKRGYPHLHILQKGEFVPWHWLKAVLPRCGFGPICSVKKVYKSSQAAHYVTKYLAKSLTDTNIGGLFDRRIWTSRHFFSTPDAPPIPPDSPKLTYGWTAIHIDELLSHIIRSDDWDLLVSSSGTTYHCTPKSKNLTPTQFKTLLKAIPGTSL